LDEQNTRKKMLKVVIQISSKSFMECSVNWNNTGMTPLMQEATISKGTLFNLQHTTGKQNNEYEYSLHQMHTRQHHRFVV
jgi:uncharacterized membrane protein YqhA